MTMLNPYSVTIALVFVVLVIGVTRGKVRGY